ncbi:MAG: hypothetical protein JSU06_10350 [Actinobacteria bacterium]|nr:hypothetical protein [Actinomycetota bacterium]
MSNENPRREKAIEALRASPKATVEEVAGVVGVGRSTAHKYLAALIADGRVQRYAGGRDGGRKLPDRYSLIVGEEEDGTGPGPEPATGRAASRPARLRPGELDGLVVGFMRDHPDGAPFTPGAVAAGLRRSNGAVGNCLERLASREEVDRVSEKPRRYAVRTG